MDRDVVRQRVLVHELDLEGLVGGHLELRRVEGGVQRVDLDDGVGAAVRRRWLTRFSRLARLARRTRLAGSGRLAGWRRGRRLVDVLLEPHVEVGPGHRVDLERHEAVARTAQLGALPAEHLAGILGLDRDVELADAAGDDVPLEEELRDVERVDDVAAFEHDANVLFDREGHAAALALRHELGVDDLLAAFVVIVELPLELGGEGPHLELRRCRQRFDAVQRPP